MALRPPPAVLALLAAAPLAALAGCQSAPLDPGRSQGHMTSASGPLPISRDLALLPVEDAGVDRDAPTEELFGALEEALRDAGFSPLAPDYVRTHAAEAAHAGQVRVPGATVVAVQVLDWDDERLASLGYLEARTQILAYAPDGSVSFRGVLEYAGRLTVPQQAEMDLDRRRSWFAGEVAGELVERLPRSMADSGADG